MKRQAMRSVVVALVVVGGMVPAWADHTLPDIVKGSKMIGTSVQDSEGTELGEIEDLAIDEVSGEVRYVVLPFRGIRKMNEKYFAIPWDALTLSHDRSHFVVGMKEDTLEQAPRFDEEEWPNFADPAYYRTMYEFYHLPVPPKGVAGETGIEKTHKGIRDKGKGDGK